MASAQTPDGFLSQGFIQNVYQEHVGTILRQIRRVLVEQYTDFNGQPLIADDELVLILGEDAVTANAYVIGTRRGGTEVTITLGLVILIDLLSAARWAHVMEIMPGAPRPTPSFDTACSPDLSAVLRHSLPRGLTERAKVQLAGFFTNEDGSMREDWERMTTLSLLWVLSHEVGHFLCGHAGYYSRGTGIVGLSEKPTSAEIEAMIGATASTSEGALDVPATKIKWACELMADIYATIRVGWIVCQEVKARRIDLSISHVVNSIITPSVLPIVAFLVGREEGEGKQAGMLQEFYPSEWCRVFNVFATVVFLVYPLENASLDPRKNPLESFWRENLHTDWKMFLVEVLEYFESIESFLRVFNLTPFSVEDSEQVAEHFCASVISARNGLVTPGTTSRKARTPLLPHLLQWSFTMKSLCTETNIYFSAHLKDTWLTRGGEEFSLGMIRDEVKSHAETLMKIGGMPNDPAYKILDDWMSQIYATWECEEDEIAERLHECAVHGRHVVEIRRGL